MHFDACTNLASITIPSTITSIGANAFDGCRRLDNVVIPNGVTEIKSATFSCLL